MQMRSWQQHLLSLWQTDAVKQPQCEQAVYRWYQSAVGQRLLAVERAAVSQLLDHGYQPTLVQIDAGARTALFDAQQRQCKSALLLSQQPISATCASVQATFTDLPLQPESVDWLLLHHALELSTEPHRLLREAVQALRPGGQLVIMGFNAQGFWGWRRWLRLGSPLRTGRWLSLTRVQDWCHLLECDAVHKQWLYHGNSEKSARWLASWSRIQQWVFDCWPALGPVYVLVIRKNQWAKPQGPRWKPTLWVAGKAVNRKGQAVNRWKS